MDRKTKRYLLIFAILAGSVGGAAMLGKMKPPPEKKAAAALDTLVEVMPLVAETVQFTVQSQGTVRPRTETQLSAEVSGSIVSISPKFIAGGVFAAGETLLRIDPANYEVAVEQAEALLEQRRIEFEGARTLRSQGYRAESEYASAAAALASAKADLVRAQRNLERTYIRLPYEGMVRSKLADLGQYVNPGTLLGVTFATDYAEIRLPLTDEDLAFVDLPSAADIAAAGEARGPSVRFSATRAGRPAAWSGRIVRGEGVIDENTRVTYAVARIEDPFALHDTSGQRVPLPVGTFVAAAIEGHRVEAVLRVPRTALRGNRQLVVVDVENRLQIRNVTLLRADAEYAYIYSGVAEGERIALTVIENPVNGMKVRVAGQEPEKRTEPPADVSGGAG
ncbi:MAG: efflux RND transporter periplasmic adaptor subunit [Gammaproteobacteria bacterium]|nr:efflux RND transporter periplasmic adaptor subunit [Gammaproteobacteria bacterium]MDH4253654.1 efflux RND transporter periplasmic adaptor subunit [Gammaproteobacteria bacterium]MDH5309770.1 efflux RND transporter periplasmic adaptor subunit [Gammaproteobacteria bacterium]